jgi:hypothetical protein
MPNNINNINNQDNIILENLNTPTDGKEVFKYTLDFFLKNPTEYEKVKAILKAVVTKLSQDALSHTTFCNLFATPNNLPDAIFKILNLSARQVADAYYKNGFYQSNSMHSDSYYHVLLLLYYVGLEKDDQIMRLYALTLIYVKLYNGRKTKYFPKGCIPEIASYIVNNVLRTSHTFKRFKTPFHIVVEYWAPSLDQTYALRIRKNPFDQREGLIKILSQAWSRVDQTFMGIQEHYYHAHANGLQDVSFKSTSNDYEMQEKINQDESLFENLAEKINRTLMIKKHKIDMENLQKISRSLILPVPYIEKTEQYFNDFEDDDADGLRPIFESILKAFNLTDESSICNMHISATATKIGGNQTDKNIAVFKNIVDKVCVQIFKDIFTTQTYNQQQKIRKLITTIILFRMKSSVCKDTKYDGF